MKAWIARDKDGLISIFNVKPIKNRGLGYWHLSEIGWGDFCWGINPKDIPNINPQWEDEEPIEVELTIKRKTNEKRN